MATYENVEVRLASRGRWVQKEAEKYHQGPNPFGLTTGARDPAEQKRLSKAWKNWCAALRRVGCSNVYYPTEAQIRAAQRYAPKAPVAAEPGFSKHERRPAEAIDISCDFVDNALRARLARQAGLITPVPGEPWHMELGPVLESLPALVVNSAQALKEVAKVTDMKNPAVAIGVTPSNKGYWVLLADGAVITFGDAPFHGGRGGSDVENAPMSGFAATQDGSGYVLLGADGGVFPFGSVQMYGSAVEHTNWS